MNKEKRSIIIRAIAYALSFCLFTVFGLFAIGSLIQGEHETFRKLFLNIISVIVFPGLMFVTWYLIILDKPVLKVFKKFFDAADN